MIVSREYIAFQETKSPGAFVLTNQLLINWITFKSSKPGLHTRLNKKNQNREQDLKQSQINQSWC